MATSNAAAPERKMNWFLDLMLHHFQIFLWKLLMPALSYSKYLKIAASDDNNSSSFLESPLQRSLETLLSTHCLHSLLLTDNHLFFFTVLSHWQLNSWKWQWKRRIDSAPIKGRKVHAQKNTLRDWEESLVSKKFLLHFTRPCLPGLVPGLSSPPFNAHLLVKYRPTMLQWETSKAVKVFKSLLSHPRVHSGLQLLKYKDERWMRWAEVGLSRFVKWEEMAGRQADSAPFWAQRHTGQFQVGA